jgi:hypothetical protein
MFKHHAYNLQNLQNSTHTQVTDLQKQHIHLKRFRGTDKLGNKTSLLEHNFQPLKTSTVINNEDMIWYL